MKMPWDDLDGPAKVLAISAAVLLVAGGLCGVQFLIISGVRGNAQALVSVFTLTGILELIAIVMAGLTAAGALLAWTSTAIHNRFTGSRGKRDETQKLFDDSDKRDEPH